MEIKHIYTATGSHYLVVNGVRGDTALYESVATHPAGYIAITAYYTGDDEGRVMKVEFIERYSGGQSHLTTYDPNRKVRNRWSWSRLWRRQDKREQNRYAHATKDLFGPDWLKKG
jgi:hypothetical protein